MIHSRLNSIRAKIVALVAVISSLALVLASASFVVNGAVMARASKAKQVSAMAELLGSNSTAALSFGESDAAEELLSALRNESTIRYACLYDELGEVFASYRRNTSDSFAPPDDPAEGSSYANGGLEVALPIIEHDERIGSIYVKTTLEDLNQQFTANLAGVGLAMGVAVVIAVAVTVRLERLISRPILELADTTKAISAGGDYSIRVATGATDEIGILYRGFNEMLQRIETSEAQLREARDRLEQRVIERTEELSTERRLLRTIIDSVPHGLFWKGADTAYLGCNRFFAKLVGVGRPEEIVGLTDTDLLNNVATEADDQLDQEVMRTGEAVLNIEQDLVSAAGDQLIFWTSKTPLLNDNGAAIGVVGVLADVTEKKLAEAERDRLLHESQEQRALLDGILQSVPDGIIAADEGGRFLCINNRAEEILGKSGQSTENVQQWTEHHPLYEPEGKAPLSAESTPLYKAIHGESETNRELVLRQEEGQRVLSANATPLVGDGCRGGVITFRDVTDQKLLEQQLAQAQKLESIGQLAAGLAHEINTPMQFVRDNIEFLSECSDRIVGVVDLCDELLEDSKPIDWEERRREVRELKEQSRFEYLKSQVAPAIDDSRDGIIRVVKIITAMKEFSHPGVTIKEAVDLNQLVESTVAITRNTWKYQAQMDLDLAAELPHVPAFASELNQVLLNLVVNATDAIAERYGEEDHEAEEILGRIGIRTRLAGEMVAIEVEDNGCGIPEEHRKRVFDMFFTTKQVGKGTGQGLSIVHNVVVSQHGGRVDLQSEPGLGTTFTVYLPIVDADATHGNDTAEEVPAGLLG